jgi:DNA polymerase-3 subunit delta
MVMKIDAPKFLAQLHMDKPLPHVLGIVGEEPFYRDKVRKGLLKKIFAMEDTTDCEITVFADKANLDQLENVINTYPFFGGQSVALITDMDLMQPKIREGKTSKTGEARLKKLLELLSDIPDYCTVILQADKLDGRQKLSKTLQKEYCLVECEPLKPYRLEPWLNEQATQYGAVFTKDGMEKIMAYMMNVQTVPMQLLAGEIEKLSLYAGKRKEWTGEDVEHIFAALPEVSFFAMADAMSKGKTVNMLELLAAEKKKGTNILPVAGMIAAKLRTLLLAAEYRRMGYGKEDMVANLHMNPYAANFAIQEARHFPEAALEKALLDLDQMSIEFKRGGRGYPRLEEILVMLLLQWQ